MIGAIKHKVECKSDTIQKRSTDEYEIVNQGSLGRGSFGCVKLVRDRQSGLLYAMKMVNISHNKIDKTDLSIENLKREIRIQKKLKHPHVIQLFHYFEDQQYVYLILEYATNGSLFSYLRKRKQLPENEAFVYFFQTALGIDYLHKNKIIHRDLKPENLLLDDSGNIKICDFGWSAEMLQNQSRTTFCGTIDYMTPEMLEDKPHDYSLDLWCLGILLYELLHGHAPFRGKNDYEKCSNIQKQEDFIFECGQEAKDLILNLLKREPTKRLSLQKVFEHPWMVQMAATYSIDIKDYMFEQKQNDLSNSLKIDSKFSQMTQSTSQSIKQKETLSFSTYSAMSYTEDNPIKPRITRRQTQPQKELSFFESIFKNFGCTKRD